MQRVEAVVAASVASGAAALVALSAACGNPDSFDHLVGPGEQRRRHFKADRLGGMQIDRQFELGRSQRRQTSLLSRCDRHHARLAKQIQHA
jgi:hypothetical protein